MLPLAIAILSTSAFTLIIRHTQRRGLDQMTVMLANYLVASAAGFVLTSQSCGWQPSPATLRIGLIAGVIYVTTYMFIMHSLELRGVAIANAVTRISVLIPMVAAIVIWHERPHLLQEMGAGLAVLAMPLLSLDRGHRQLPWNARQLGLLLALFLTNGAVLITSKWFHSAGAAQETYLYFGLVYGVSAVIGTGLWLLLSRRLDWAAARWGALLGMVNIVTGVMLLAALDQLPGAVVFPVFAALGLTLTTGFAAVAWEEIPGRLGRAGIAVALVAVVLINL